MALFTQTFSLTATSSASPTPTPTPTPIGPTVSGGMVTADFGSTTTKQVVSQLYGGSTATFLDFNFAAMNNTTLAASSKALNMPLLRFNCNSGASGGNVWLNAFPNGPTNAMSTSVVAPLVNHLNTFVDLTKCKVIMGFGGVTGNDTNGWSVADFATALTTVANYFRTTPGSDGNPINIKYWEIMNEYQISTTTYNSYFNACADALHAIDPSYSVMGPTMPNLFGEVSALISGSNATRLAMADGHFYLYCPGSGDPVPSDVQVAQAQTGGAGTTPEAFAANINSTIAGTYLATKPFFTGEYNIGCGPNDTNNREQAILGACFAASCLGKLVSNSNPVVWAGLWEYGTAGGWGTFNSSGSTVDPQGYFLSKGAAVMPGTMVTSSANSGLYSFATVNGSTFGLTIVNYTASAITGQVALSRWPVNPTGTSSISHWELSANHLQGSVSTLAVTNGLTASFTIPGQSVVMLYP